MKLKRIAGLRSTGKAYVAYLVEGVDAAVVSAAGSAAAAGDLAACEDSVALDVKASSGDSEKDASVGAEANARDNYSSLDSLFQVVAKVGEREVPAEAHLLDVSSSVEALGAAARKVGRLLVVVLPFLDGERARYTVGFDGVELCSASLNFSALKWESRLAYRSKRALCDVARDCEQGLTCGHYQLSFERGLPSDAGMVWRVLARWVGDPDAIPALELFDKQMSALDAKIHTFEVQTDVARANGTLENRVLFSIEIAGDVRDFVVKSSDPSRRIATGFCSMDGRFFNTCHYDSWRRMKDARADDAAYRAWFDVHRAKPGDLAAQAVAAQGFAHKPFFSIVVPCYHSNAGYLKELVESVRVQSYGNWELLLVDSSPEDGVVRKFADASGDERIKRIELPENKGIVGNTNAGIAAATGDYVAFLDHDDLLEPDALFHYAKAINEPAESLCPAQLIRSNGDGAEDETSSQPLGSNGGQAEGSQLPSNDLRPQVLFCDEDMFETMDNWGQPVFKTQLNVDLLYSHNCVTHFLVVARALIEQIGVSPEDVTGAQDYDLTLRALAAGARFKHVPRVLYHWRMHAGSTADGSSESKPYAIEAGRLALSRHFDQLGIDASVEETKTPFVYRVNYALPEPHPLVSIVIPTKDHLDVLRPCLDSIARVSTYDNYEVVLVENNSTSPDTFEFYKGLPERFAEASGGKGSLRVVTWEGAFNYSAIINFGVSHAKGDYLLLLNNDTEVISPDFMQGMMGYLQRPDVGVVGAKLYYADGLTQHAGVLVGVRGAVAHANQDFPKSREGYLARAVRPGNFSAVTGACQMVRRGVFEEIGGYDESFAVGFNDIDFCLRAGAAGYRTVFTPYAELYHFEFTSRGREEADKTKLARWKSEQARFIERWPSFFLEGDPYLNPNLDKDSDYFDLPK